MSLYRQSRSLPRRFRLVLTSFLHRSDLPFADALPEEAIDKAFDEQGASFADEEDAVYTPAVTLWAFLSQVLFKSEQRSCVAAVARVGVLLIALERGPCSHNSEPGNRTESFVVVTTLTDAAVYAKEDIAELYRYRWRAELDIRAIKITMGMDILRCKTPDMVRKEMWTCLLAYNLIRRTMLQAARASGLSPRELRFTAAVQSIATSWAVIVQSGDAAATLLIEAAWANLAGHVIGRRPGRVEPRAVKRRPKPHDLLTKPRDQARPELLKEKREKSP